MLHFGVSVYMRVAYVHRRYQQSNRPAFCHIALPMFNLEGPGGDMRRSLTFNALAELLRRRLGPGTIGTRTCSTIWTRGVAALSVLRTRTWRQRPGRQIEVWLAVDAYEGLEDPSEQGSCDR